MKLPEIIGISGTNGAGKDTHTAPFIDDFIVNPEHLPEFFPRMRKIIKKYKLFATIAGHMGDGNFHIIPLMKLEDPKDRAKLEPAMKEVNNLVLEYKGSLSGEHNDGLVRGPWLEAQYGKEVVDLFKQRIFSTRSTSSILARRLTRRGSIASRIFAITSRSKCITKKRPLRQGSF